jgi:hypothetical protein
MKILGASRNAVRVGTILGAVVLAALMAFSGAPNSVTSHAAATLTPTLSSPALLSGGPPLSSTATIQAEIDAAAPGATVHIPAGTFVGQLRIHKSLELVGAGEGSTILQSLSVMSPDYLGNVFVVEVNNRATVSISELSVRVTEQCMLSNSIGVATGGGIGAGSDATVHVWDVAVVAYGPSPDLNVACTTSTDSAGMFSFGRAISIGLDDPPGVGTNFEVEGHGTISNVFAQGFDIFSLSVGGVRGPSGSTATITNNVVRVGPGPFTAAYGIVVYGNSTVSNNLVTGVAGSDGGIAVVAASAVVTYNTVLNFTCLNAPFPITPACGVDPLFDDQDLGIFLASITPGTIVRYNTIQHVDSGILVEGPEPSAFISNNQIDNSTFYSLEVIDASQIFQDNSLLGGMFAIAVGAEATNSTGVLLHDTIGGDSVSIALLESISPWSANVVVLPK